jgi:hypothetical protein
MASPVLSPSTLNHTAEDLAANPNSIASQLVEALTPGSSRPDTPPTAAVDGFLKQSPVRDEEGVPLPGSKLKVEPMTGTATGPAATAHKTKKIAVLTSGGDSAGMNAAGESS